ncbi:MAG TPA: STAS domain-containing protein [Actinomycetales bacterium]|nr:STAS domain-containing protein [Actinomycetales bacterium]
MSIDSRPPPRYAAAQLTGTVASDRNVTLVRLSGELDLATEGALAAIVDGLLTTAAPLVRLDLTGVTFCDARGLSAILAARRRLLASHRGVRFSGAGRFLRRLLQLTHLDEPLNADGWPTPR